MRLFVTDNEKFFSQVAHFRDGMRDVQLAKRRARTHARTHAPQVFFLSFATNCGT
jgi:hypothetical protein